MNRFYIPVMWAFLLSGALFAQNALQTVTGTVFPDDMDKEGNPVSVYIEVQGKDEAMVNYFVVNDGKGRELLTRLYTTVSAMGVVRNESNRNILTVQKYVIVDNPPENLDNL